VTLQCEVASVVQRDDQVLLLDVLRESLSSFLGKDHVVSRSPDDESGRLVLPEVLLEGWVEIDVRPVRDEEGDLSFDGVSKLEVGEVVGLGREEVKSRIVVGVLQERDKARERRRSGSCEEGRRVVWTM